jgi:hypothetical protein
MDKSQRDAILNEDFGWLQDIQVIQVDGKLMLGNDDMPFNVSAVLRERDFVKEWLMPFALGNDLGVNYFNVQKWAGMSNRGTQSVLVVDDNNQPVVLVKPLISHNMTPHDFELMRAVSRHIQQVQADTTRSKDPNASMKVAGLVKEHIQAKRLTLTELVSPEFYAKHGIIPEVEQKIYYIKDVVRRNEAPIEEITRSRDILYRDHRKEVVTADEYRFLHDLSKGQFIIDEKVEAAPTTISAAERETPSNPLEC